MLQKVEVRGATVLTHKAFDEAAAPWMGQMVGTLELARLAQALTQVYADAGFEGSGVALADQVLADGTVRFEAREVFIADIEVPVESRWLRPAHVRRSFEQMAGRPLHVPSLRSLMIRLRESGLYERLDAEVQLPAAGSSEARLVVVADPANPFHVQVSTANNRNPSIGSRRDEISVQHASATGHGDLLEYRTGRTSGLDDSQLRYEFPFPQFRVRAFAQATRSNSIAIEPPLFRVLDIRSTADIDLAGLQYTLRETAEEQWLVQVQGERRTSLTTLLGIPFSFTPGLPDAQARSRAIRLESQWSRRSSNSGWAVRTTFIQGSVRDSVPIESGFGIAPRYRIVQAGFEGAWRPGTRGSEWRLRLEAQHSRDTLLAADRISLGGASTVRGYRENAALRDQGALASLEWRAPPYNFWDMLSVTPGVFADAAVSRNAHQVDDGAPRRLASAGLMLESTFRNRLQLKLHWGRARERQASAGNSLQDRGFHLSLQYRLW